ncbi:MAG TPA: SIS domain-containing protein [Anaerolineales bacterium]|nr:SIS domain-containing protein [Anaerolineales bacterium]
MSLRDEIFQQAEVLQELLKTEWSHVLEITDEIRKREIKYIFLAARGTSDNAGLYVKYTLGINNAIPVALAAPSMFSIYHSPPNLKNSLVLSISQSGQSPDIVEVVEEGKRQGAMTLALTNKPDSPLAVASDHVINVQAGEEKAVAATKSYTAQLFSAAMLSASLSENEVMYHDLQRVPEFVSQVLTLETLVNQIVERFYYMEQCVVIGRGYNYTSAFEWALKMKEMTYLVAEAYSSADFLHGPIAMTEMGFPVFMVAPSGQVYPALLHLAKRLQEEKKVNLLILSDQDKILEYSAAPVRLPAGLPEWISPIVSIVPAQLFCLALAKLRGLDTENPRGLSKVTLTT